MSYFPKDLQPASVAWEIGQRVSPVHFYAMESHLRSAALLPPLALAPTAGLSRVPIAQPASSFEVRCDIVSATHRILHIEVARCTGITPTRQWIWVTEGISSSVAIDPIEGRWPDLYLSLHRTGTDLREINAEAPDGSISAEGLGRDTSHALRMPVIAIEITRHEPHTQKGLPSPGPDGLVFGRVVERNGTYEVDQVFTPPAVFLRDLPAWEKRAQDIRVAIERCSDEVRGYFAQGLSFDPLKKKTHVLHQLSLILAGMRGVGRNPWDVTISLIQRYYESFEVLSTFLQMHRDYLQSLDEDGSLLGLVDKIHQAAQLLSHFPPGHATINAAPLLDVVQKAFPTLQQIAGRVRQSLEQDRRTPPDNHFITKEPFFQLKHWTTRLFQKGLSGRIQLDLPRGDLPGRVKLLRAVAVLFYFQPIQGKDIYNTGDPQVRWRINEAETWRETGVLLRENPLREAANAVGYVGVLMDLTDVNLDSLDQLSLWLPGDNVPREARCYAHFEEEPEVLLPHDTPPTPMQPPPPPSSPVW